MDGFKFDGTYSYSGKFMIKITKVLDFHVKGKDLGIDEAKKILIDKVKKKFAKENNIDISCLEISCNKE